MRLLIVEDRAADAELMAAQLAADGLELDWVRIETRAELLDALEESVDLVISDFELPTLDAMDVIGIVAEKAIGRPPVIVVSGTVTDGGAVKCLRAGADDYVLKDRPARLGAAARRALERRTLEQHERRAREELYASEQQFRALVESMEDIVYTLDRDGRHTGIYGRWLEREGLTAEMFIGHTGPELFGPGAADHTAAVASALRGDATIATWSFEGEQGRRDFQTSLSPLRDADGTINGVVASARELTEQHRAAEALMRAQREVIARLLLAAEFRDRATGAHVTRMGSLCGEIARRLGLDEQRCESIASAAAMHDNGKIGIPDTVLLKPGQLTAEERTIMNSHTEIGHRMLAGSGFELLDLAAKIALTHHERFDGTGYPAGLARYEIPLEGRIAAVADVFDALQTERTYRPAFDRVTALEMMEQQRGKHFDPAILEVLFDIAAAAGPGEGGSDACVGPPLPSGAGPRRARPARASVDSEAPLDAERLDGALDPVVDLRSGAVLFWRLRPMVASGLDEAVARTVADTLGIRPRLDRRAVEIALESITSGVGRVLVPVGRATVRSGIAAQAGAGELIAASRPARGALAIAVPSAEGGAIAATRLAVNELRRLGCSVALEDFGSGSSLELAAACRFDYLLLSAMFCDRIAISRQQQLTVRSLAQLADDLGGRLVAGPLATAEQLEALRAVGVEAVFGPALEGAAGRASVTGNPLSSLRTC